MARVIDADLLEKEIYKWMPKDQETWMDSDLPPIENLVVSIMMTIQEQPTVDAEPVKRGHWERHNTYHFDDVSGSIDPDWRCSECGGQANVNVWGMYDLTAFCPNCGAKMNEIKDEYVTLHHEDIHFIDEDAEKAFYEALDEEKEE